MAIKSLKLRESARDQACTMNVVDICNCDSSTTVLCHIQTEMGIMGGKTDDISAAFGCSDCHLWLDQNFGSELDRLFYTRRAMIRTHIIWLSMGLLIIK